MKYFVMLWQYRLLFVVFALSWDLISVLSAYPHHLGYFNELSGGSHNGGNIMIFSAIEWGQDLYLLRSYIDNCHPNSDLFLAWYGHGYYQPIDIGLTFSLVPQKSLLETGEDYFSRIPPGVYAISISLLQGADAHDQFSKSRLASADPLTCTWFKSLRPVTVVGSSFHVYKIE